MTPSLSPRAAVQFCFGRFSIDLEERLLRREGEVVSLPPKVVETLILLLENAGELVSKEALLEKVWGGAFVEDNSITQNISRLRRLLDPEFPDETVIHTVPKRGYRLGLKVEVVAGEPEALPAPVVMAPEVMPEPVAPTLVAEFSQARPAKRRWIAMAIAAVLLVVVPLAIWRSHIAHTQAAMNTRLSVAVLGFQDLQGQEANAWLSTALNEMMFAELDANQQLRMVPNDEVAQMRSETDLKPGVSLGRDSLAEVRRRLNCDMVVSGHYLQSGGKIRIDAVLQDARTGETLGTFSRTDAADHFLPLIALTGQDLRRKLGEQELTAEQTGQMLASIAANPAALQAYSQGMERLRAMDAIGAQPFLEEAIRLEPGYPMAHVALSNAWSLMGYDAKALQEAQAAFRLADRLSREERLEVEARYYEVAAQWDKATETYSALWRFFPDNMEYGLALARVQIASGKAADAMAVVKKLGASPSPGNVDPRIALTEAQAYGALSQFAESGKAADRAIAQARSCRNLAVLGSALVVRGDDASRLGDTSAARAEFAEAKSLAERVGDRAAVVKALRSDADVVRQGGDLDSAQRENNDAMAVATAIGDRRDQVKLLLNMTQILRPTGNLPKQKEYAEMALQLARDLGDKTAEGAALLVLGNVQNNMGDPDASRVTYAQCAELAKQTGDKQLLARATGNLGVVEYTHGKLDAGRSLIEQALAMSRQQGEKASVAYKLGHYSSVLLYQDHLDQARAAAKETCDLETSMGEKLNVASCQVYVADILIQQGRSAEAIGPLTAITSTLTTQNPTLKAWMLLAEAQLELGNVPAAKVAVDRAQALAKGTVNEQDFLIPLAYIAGRVQAAQGQDAAALKGLQGALERATALKLVPMALRIRLAMAEIRMKARPAEGIRLAQGVETDARSAGFARIAANAQKAESKSAVAVRR